MQPVYLNYASTSPRKSRRVIDAISSYLEENRHMNSGRNIDGLDDAAILLRSRLMLGRLFGVDNPSRVVFTSGVTASLNMLLWGMLEAGDHVLSTSIEHNAVARPLTLLRKTKGIEVTWLECEPDGTLDPALVDAHVRKNTRLLVMSHASNVLGSILPVASCFEAAKRHGLMTVLDSAQTAGGIDFRLDANTDVIAFSGHKGLGGLGGAGGFVLGDGIGAKIHPWLTGGTGSVSHELDQPDFLPDKFEPGTPNTVGILALGASVEELCEIGIATIREKEVRLTRRFLDGVRGLPAVVHGAGDADKSMPVVSLAVPGADLAVLARRLYDEHGILIRCGLHCSPLAHRTAGTLPQGTLRFSFGYATTEQEIDLALAALERVLSRR
ncbi:MAG: aminotransferase class V-fold PLP-dependent enzyme [Planctomycetota bacterium]|jgi:cysteine desulfurase family protein|nr:aminotransferase class V-fold PLP-dependent enzyme [Planctomycetota bacterium]